MAAYKLIFPLGFMSSPGQLSLSRYLGIVAVMAVVVIDVSANSQPASSARTDGTQPCLNHTNNTQVLTSNDSSNVSLEPILRELAEQGRQQLNISYQIMRGLDHIISKLDDSARQDQLNISYQIMRGLDHVMSKLGESSRQDQLNVSDQILDRQLNVSDQIIDQHDSDHDQIISNSSASNATEVRPRDCLEVQRAGFSDSGPYMLYPDGDGEPFRAYCDMTTDGGGWTVFQKRETGNVNFYRNWAEYRDGFGDVLGEHWLGNDRIHRLSTQDRYELRVDLEDFYDRTAYAVYSSFYVEDEEDYYRLRIGDYRGTAGASFDYHNGQRFSTKDSDNDEYSGNHCAQSYHGGWWFNRCVDANLNGRYYPRSSSASSFHNGIVWWDWKRNYPLMKTEMKVRPV